MRGGRVPGLCEDARMVNAPAHFIAGGDGAFVPTQFALSRFTPGSQAMIDAGVVNVRGGLSSQATSSSSTSRC
jgi:hypothetical protein